MLSWKKRFKNKEQSLKDRKNKRPKEGANFFAYFQILPVLAVIPALFLIHENLGRGVFLIVLILVWALIAWRIRNFVFSSILLLVFASVFNVTIQIPHSDVGILNYSQTVYGVYTNWLVPTVSIIDLFMAILLYELVLIFGFTKTLRFAILSLFCLVIIAVFGQLVSVHKVEVLFLVNIGRWFLYVITGVLAAKYFLSAATLKEIKISLILFVAMVFLQIIIANFQVSRGASIGLDFLGESKLVVQVYGVSFIDFFGRVILRGYGTFPHPNILCAYIIAAIVIVFAIPLNRYLKGFLLFALTLGALLTFSKIGIFVVTLIILLGILKFNPDWRVKLFLLVILPLTLVALQYFNIEVPLLADSTSWIDRHNLLIVAKDVFMVHPLFGVGVGNFVSSMSGLAPTTTGGYLLLQPVHNIFILWLVENGIVGVALQLVFFVVICKKSRLLLSIPNILNNRVWFLSSISIVLLGSFDHYFLTLPQGIFLLVGFFIYSMKLIDDNF